MKLACLARDGPTHDSFPFSLSESVLVVVCLLSSLCGCPQTGRWRVQFASQPAPHVCYHLVTRRDCRCGRSCLHILLPVLFVLDQTQSCLWGSGFVLFHSNPPPPHPPPLFFFKYFFFFNSLFWRGFDENTTDTLFGNGKAVGQCTFHRIRKMYCRQQDSENLLAATGFGKSIGYKGKNLSGTAGQNNFHSENFSLEKV